VDENALPGADEARRLAEILWRHGFQGRRAIVAVPESSILASVVEVPPAASGAPIATIASAELARLHGADGAELETDFWPLPPCGPKGQRHEAIAVGVRRADMMSLLESLQSQGGGGFEVVAADAPPCARARAAMSRQPADRQWAIIDLGWSASRLSVVHDNLIVYERALPDSGLAHLELRLEQECALKPDDIRHVLGKSPGAAPRRISGAWQGAIAAYAAIVAAEVKDSLRYLSLNRGIELPRRAILTGGGAESDPVVKHLAEAIDGAAPFDITSHLHDRPAHDAPPDPRSGLTTALGLALRAA
jgi:Tfp pilus assembly PilM family ATPase